MKPSIATVSLVLLAGGCNLSTDRSSEPAPVASPRPTMEGHPAVAVSSATGNGAAGPAVPPPSDSTADGPGGGLPLASFREATDAVIYYEFKQPHPDLPGAPRSQLRYALTNEAGEILVVSLPYAGSPGIVPLDAGGVGLSEAGFTKQWIARGGQARIGALTGGRLRIDFTGLVLRDGTAQRSMGAGSVEGRVVKLCYKLATLDDINLTGRELKDHVHDPDWSSPFCSALRPK